MLKTVERTFPKITQQGLDELRQRIGVQIGVTAEPWCYEACLLYTSDAADE